MLIGALFAACVVAVGFGTVRGLRLAGGLLALGLAPAAGLGVLVVVTVWCGFLGLSPTAGAMLVVGFAGLGIVAGIRDRTEFRKLAASPEIRITFGLICLATVVPAVVLGMAFNGIAVPESSHDGAHHTEIINLLRQGGHWTGWYPLGFHSVTAAFLQLLPSLDTAEGALDVGLGLAVLAPLSAFGLGLVIMRRTTVAAAGSVLVGLTAQYPYHLQFWDGWPLAVAIILSVGLWTVAAQYVKHPTIGWAILGAVLTSGIVLAHGTELYTAGIGLIAVVVADWRRINWKGLLLHLAAAAVVAAAMAIPYVPGLLEFSRAGVAVGAGEAELTAMTTPAPTLTRIADSLHLELDSVGAVVLDVPLRTIVLLIGIVSAFRQRSGRLLVPLGLIFFCLSVVFQGLDNAAVQRVYSVTFPWSQDYRLLMITALCASLLGGAGLVAIIERFWCQRRLVVVRAGLILGLTLAWGSAVLEEQRFAAESQHYLTFSVDDQFALNWLGQHVQSGDIVVNDGSADAGIWAPYKAGATILLPRALPVGEPAERAQVREQVANLAESPTTVASACGLGVRYVYIGASGTLYEARQFPPISVLRQSTALDEVYARGDAAVFQVRCSPA